MENLFMKEKLDNLHGYKPEEAGIQLEFTLFTKVDAHQSLMNLCASDGDEVFTKVILDEDLDAIAEDCGCVSKEDLLGKIRTCITNNAFSVSSRYDHVLVQFQKGSSSFSLKLYAPTASERKELLKFSYFQMAQTLLKFQSKISMLETELDEAKKNIPVPPVAATMSSIFEPDFKRPKQSKPKQMKGGSLINPGSRRKKAASGVVFDDD